MSRMQSLDKHKKLQSAAIEQQVQEYLDNGGVILNLRSGLMKSAESLSQNEYHSKVKAAADERRAAYGRRYQAKLEKNSK